MRYVSDMKDGKVFGRRGGKSEEGCELEKNRLLVKWDGFKMSSTHWGVV